MPSKRPPQNFFGYPEKLLALIQLNESAGNLIISLMKYNMMYTFESICSNGNHMLCQRIYVKDESPKLYRPYMSVIFNQNIGND